METLTRIAGVIVGIALFIAAFIFTSVILAIGAVFALLLWGWLMWRTRHLRREMERAVKAGEGVVIEGEYRVEQETRRLDDDRR